jgi:hypothetical protein
MNAWWGGIVMVKGRAGCGFGLIRGIYIFSIGIKIG